LKAFNGFGDRQAAIWYVLPELYCIVYLEFSKSINLYMSNSASSYFYIVLSGVMIHAWFIFRLNACRCHAPWIVTCLPPLKDSIIPPNRQSPNRVVPLAYQPHLPSLHPVLHRSSHFAQSNVSLPSFSLTALCASHIQVPNSLLLLTLG